MFRSDREKGERAEHGEMEISGNKQRTQLTIVYTMPKLKANKIEIISLALINSAIVHLPYSLSLLRPSYSNFNSFEPENVMSTSIIE